MALEYWVSAHGSDAGTGTREDPFATLECARDTLRKVRTSGSAPGGATVWLMGGVYELNKTFELSRKDSGTSDTSIVYRAAPGEEVRISGGKRIPPSAFKPVTDGTILARLDPAAQGKVVQADLKALGVSDFGRLTRRGGIRRDTFPAPLELFFDDQPMTLARWPNEDWTKIEAVPEGDACDRFTYQGERPRRWRNLDDIWLHGYMTRNWCDTYEQVIGIDTEKREVVTSKTYDSDGLEEGYKAGQHYYFLNIFEELDEPGEWYLDRRSGILYFWPPAPLEQGTLCVSLRESPLVALHDTAHVMLRGMILECTRGCGIEILGGHHNLIAGCTLRNIGTAGVALGGLEGDLGHRIYTDATFVTDAGTDNGVVSCEIYNVGEYGVILGGGNRKTLAPGRNYAVNNDFHHFSRSVRTYRPAVFICGVGQRVAHNLMHDAPHTAVLFWGNDHLLEFNEVHHICQETGDCGAFYIGRDWAQRGSVVRYNYFHDLTAILQDVMAVYLDDLASGTTVFGNIVCRVNHAILVGGGRDNIIENNIFVDCPCAISLDARGMGEGEHYCYGSADLMFARLKAVNHDSPPYSTHYPALARVLDGDPAIPAGNVLARNISVRSDFLTLWNIPEEIQRLVTGEDNLTEDDPGLVAPEKGDFRLRNDSPALAVGFRPICTEKVGLFQDEYRFFQ